MIQFLKNFWSNLTIFIEKNKVIAQILAYLFDYFSQITHFFLFNVVGFSCFMLFLFVVPMSHYDDFINFFVNIYSNPLDFFSCFKSLPLGLKVIFSFYFFIIESVILCTILSFIPVVKKHMVVKYNDEFILKKKRV